MAVVTWDKAATPARAVQARQARGRRFRALLLDGLLFSVVAVVVNNVYGVRQVTGGTLLTGQNSFAQYSTVTAVAWPLLVLAWFVYFIVPEILFGASVGKMFLGLCVVRVDGQPLGIGSIVARNVMRFVDALPLLYLLGGVSVLLSGNSQRLGDMVAGTTVVRRDDATTPWATRHPRRGTGRILGTALVLAIVFTIGFDYFGRPPLVLEGLYNEHQLMAPDVSSYSLGEPHWAVGQITYPFKIYRSTQACTGTLEMDWQWIGWELSGGSYVCAPYKS